MHYEPDDAGHGVCMCVYLQEASALEQNVKGKAVSAEAKRAQAVASIRREEAVLAQQANELAGQVCTTSSHNRTHGVDSAT